MKTKHVYVVNSINQNDFLIFGTRKKANDWIEHNFSIEIFDKSTKSDLFITKRVIF